MQEGGAPANAVVMVPPGTLPRSGGGVVEAVAVIRDFADRRGYLKDELKAWVVNRLCEVLYLAPGELDPNLDWARHGVDSAVALEVLADLEDKLRLRLPQALSECRNPGELASEAAARVLDVADRLPWWRLPSVATEGV
jgi:acyl carrier protein